MHRANPLVTERVLGFGKEVGFDLVAVVRPDTPSTAAHYRAWVDRGYHGQMAYLARPDAVAKRMDMSAILSGLGSIVVVAANYHTRPLAASVQEDPSRGLIASYAWSTNYHRVLHDRLDRLARMIDAEMGHTVMSRCYVDTGPVLERDLAVRAGMGFFGKSTNLIHPQFGSWLFLGEILLEAELPPSHLQATQGTCGNCTRCLDACPTDALLAPYWLDARRCLSYLTIELKGPIPRELRPLVGNHIFGCDICQQVCPWNRRFAQPTKDPDLQIATSNIAPRLLDLITLDETEFREQFEQSPILRIKRRGLLRNVAVALGCWGNPVSIPALTTALYDPEPLVRGHAAWALGRISDLAATKEIKKALKSETDSWVRNELSLAQSESG